LVQEAGVVFIDSDDVDFYGGEASGEEDDAVLDFSAFDYWRLSFHFSL
jgi:hypothetical protein